MTTDLRKSSAQSRIKLAAGAAVRRTSYDFNGVVVEKTSQTLSRSKLV
jgi:hypothetical protein